ncbi:immunoglobulin [Lachnospiraceae bacterium NSJ-143]|nr:immunoglobulin [Lachnospiraceae bacterium NSJ-143]
MELSRLEQETIILFNEAEPTAEIYTHNKKLRKKLERLSQKHPDKIAFKSGQPGGAVSYTVPKKSIVVQEPYSDERREAARQRAIQGRFSPPKQG